MCNDVYKHYLKPFLPQAPVHVLYCWSNGFTVDDGPLRSGQSVEDRLFMEAVSKG